MAGGCGESPGKKEKSKSGCPESKKDKTSKTGKDAFGRDICLKEEGNEPECHESRKRFFENGDKKSKNKKTENHDRERKVERLENQDKERKVEKMENQDRERKVEKTDCTDSTKKMEVYTCKNASGGSSNCCFSASKGSQSSCGEKVGSSKKSEASKTFERQHVESSAKPKPASSTDKDEGLHMKLPAPQVLVVRPCLPKVEKSIAAKLMRKKKLPTCFTQERKTCPQLTKAMMSEFFCIDARNKRMNECIKHYMATDPSQVLVQCSQFAKRRVQTASQQPPAGPGLLPPKYRQIIRRWLPAAGLYVVTTAAVAAWVTEWGPVVNRIPFYKDKEPKETPPPDDMLTPETPLPELPPGSENVVPTDPHGSHPAEGSGTVESSSLPPESELPPEMPVSSEESSDPPAVEAPVPATGTGA